MIAAFILAEGDRDQIQLLPETPEIIFGLIAFAIVFAFLSYYVFPRISQVLEARAKAIEGKIIEADKALEEAKATQSSYEAKLAEAGDEANEILEGARQDADNMRNQMVQTAKTEAAQIRADAEHQAAEEKNRVMIEASEQVAVLSVEIASQIVEREIDQDRHHELVDEFINGLNK